MACVHDEFDTPRVPRDSSCNLVPGQGQTVVHGDPVYAAPAGAGIRTAIDANRVCIMRYFLEDADVLSSTEGVMSIVGRLAYVRGRSAR